MAYVTGTATDYLDLWNKLLDFLQNNSTLVAANQNWEIEWSAPVGAPNSTDVVLKGPGLAGSDSIFVGLRLHADVPSDRFAIHMRGAAGVLESATEFDAHVNSCPSYSRMFLAATPMTYWFVANGRRFIVAVKISTVYEMMYCGLILPFSTPAAFPYPLFIGGTASEGSAAVDWRGTGNDHTAFYLPRYTSGSIESTSRFLSPAGEWLRCGDQGSTSSVHIYMAPDYYAGQTFGISANFGNYTYGYQQIKDRMVAAYGGQFPLTPFTLIQPSPQIQQYGVLQGIYHVPGRGNSAENIISVGGVDHLVLQNVFRTSVGGYCAIALE